MAMTETKIRTLVSDCLVEITDGNETPIFKKNGRKYYWKGYEDLKKPDQEKIKKLLKSRLKTIGEIGAWYGSNADGMAEYRKKEIIKPLIDYKDKPEESIYWLNQAIRNIQRYRVFKNGEALEK